MAAVHEADRQITLQVAKWDEGSQITPLSYPERMNFSNYIARSQPLGSQVTIVSTTADVVQLDMEIVYGTAFPASLIEETVATRQEFGGMLYAGQLLDAVVSSPGVLTATLSRLVRKGTDNPDYIPVDGYARLYASYFNYDLGGSSFTYVPLTPAHQ
ncbi:hypothetical protein Barb6_00763 [Bacteroidales bacterium Barb6]|nr:hypothetical protein Barb6_00763 [Bacteroidales bacterium Barb6]